MLLKSFKNSLGKIKGNKIRLRLIRQGDIEILRHWRNKNRFFFFDSSYISKEKQQKWFEIYQKKEDDLMFIIETLDGRPIGTIALYKIDLSKKRAELGRMIIGEIKSRRKGFGRDAAESLIKFAFSSLNLQQLRLEVFKNNQPAINFYKKVGFQKVEPTKNRSSSDRIVMILNKKEIT